MNSQKKVTECPKCKNSYFTLEINWIGTAVQTRHICESCNWSMVTSNCTSDANVQAPFCSNQSAASAQQCQ